MLGGSTVSTIRKEGDVETKMGRNPDAVGFWKQGRV